MLNVIVTSTLLQCSILFVIISFIYALASVRKTITILLSAIPNLLYEIFVSLSVLQVLSHLNTYTSVE